LKKRKQRFLAKKKAVSEIFKTMGTQMPTWKKEREMNKITHVFLQKVFQVSNKRDMF
jgi:endonuclease/exonuclease/phosphatase family metal-dependent hydrolase